VFDAPFSDSLALHHSEKGWRSATDMPSLFDLDSEQRDAFMPWLVRVSFVLDDISHAEDDALRSRVKTAYGRIALWLLRSARRGEEVLQQLQGWSDLL
jgi:hypothetical protein